MSKFWSTSALTGVGLFLETCAFYLLFGIITAGVHLPGLALLVCAPGLGVGLFADFLRPDSAVYSKSEGCGWAGSQRGVDPDFGQLELGPGLDTGG